MEKFDFEYFFDQQKETTYYDHKIDTETNKSFFITEFAGCFKVFSVLFKSRFVRISNVHELQNLFYIMKRELSIKKLWDLAPFRDIQTRLKLLE